MAHAGEKPRISRWISLGIGALTAVAAAPSLGAGEAAPSRTVDRTFVCTPMALYGALRELDVIADPRGGFSLRGTGVRSISTGYIGVLSGPTLLASDLVFARSRLERRSEADPWRPGVYAGRRRCSETSASLPLSPKGLAGPPTVFGRDVECAIRGRVLVRVRARLQSPTLWRRHGTYVGARNNVVEAQLAVRTEAARKPIA